jgi:hypothetical protein
MAAPTVASVLAYILVISHSLLIGLDGTLTFDDSHKQPGVQRLPDRPPGVADIAALLMSKVIPWHCRGGFAIVASRSSEARRTIGQRTSPAERASSPRSAQA